MEKNNIQQDHLRKTKDQKMPEITIYTRTTCSPCKTVKWFLEKKGFKFTEKNIDDPDNFNEFAAIADYQMVPLILIGNSKIQGLNLPALTRVLDYIQ